MKNQTAALRRPLCRHAIAAAIAAAFGAHAGTALAQLPTGPTIVNGSAGIVTNGGQMTITNSANAVLDWQSFNIGPQNRVRFEQPSTSSQVLNRVIGNDPSNILGSLSSNGGVWLVNPHGVLFGSNARVDVGGLVASTLPVSNDDFLTGRPRFGGTGPAGGQALNQGEIATSFGGHVWLVGTSVRNEGLVRSPGGHIVLAAGTSIELVDSGLPNVAVRVTAPDNGAVNLGTLLAPAGGSIDIHGGIVNQQGIVRADSIGTGPSGRVVIRAQGDVILGASSDTGADAGGPARAGTVRVESAAGTTLVSGRVSATGVTGAGGQVHLLGQNVGVTGQAAVDASGAGGGGEVLVGGDYQGANPAVRNATATYLGPDGLVRASATGSGDGGKVILWGEQATRVHGTIEARGGPGGGNGGLVETSGHFLDVKTTRIDVGAPRGRAGTWLLDPGNITITGCCAQESGLSHDDTADFSVTSSSDDALIEADLIAGQLREGTKVIIKTGSGNGTTQAGNIVVDHDIVVEDGMPAGGGLNLFAHNDIVVSPGVKINFNHNAIPVNFTADFDNDGAGGIALREGAQVTTGAGIGLQAATFGATPDGTILLEKNSVLDAGTGLVAVTARRLDMRDGSQVNGGHISVAADDIAMTNASLLASDTSDSGVSVTAQSLQLNGGAITAHVSDAGSEGGSGIAITADTLDVTDGTIAASSSSAGGTTYSGTLALTSNTISLTNSTLAASSTGAADAASNGTMSITSGEMVLKSSSLVASGPMSISSSRFAFSDASGEAQMSAAGISLTGNAVELDRANLVSSAGGDAITITTDTLTNNASNLSTPTGRWLIRLRAGQASFPAAALGALDYQFVQVDAAGSEFTVPGLNGIVMDDPLAVRIKVDAARPYDGTTQATFTQPQSFTTLPGFRVQPRASDIALVGTFQDKNAGTDKPILYSGEGQPFDIATAAGVPVFGATQSYVGDIVPRSVSAAGLMADNKVYDGTRTATLSGTPTGFIAGDSVTLVGATGQFDTKHAGTGKTVTIAGGTLAGTDAGNYTLAGGATATADITPRPLTVAGIQAADKVYDGNTVATLSGAFSEALPGDQLTLGTTTATFDTKDVGTNKVVTFGGGVLAGADAANYQLTGPLTTTAAITPRPITVAGIQAADKVYDGNTTATLSGGFSETLPGDQLTLGTTTATFDTKNVGTNKVVTFGGGVLAGADAANYQLTGPLTTTAAITPRPVTIAITGTVSKEYDATTGATLGANAFALDDVVAGDTLTVSGPAQGTYATPDTGRNKTVNASGTFQIAGADAPNYRIGTVNLTGGVNVVDATASGNAGTITPATLTYVAGPAVREPGLPVTGLGGTVAGFKGTDTLASATTGTLAWNSSATRFSLPGTYAVKGTGLSADNYTFVQAPGNATALTMRFDFSNAKPQRRAQDDSTHALASALRNALPVLAARGAGGGVFDRSSLAAARTFGAIPIGAMSQDELAAMLAQRREFKRKLFADAIYKLEIDPSLADVQPCATVADAGTGACRITTAQLELIHASKVVAAKTAVAKTAHVPQIERKVVVLFGINDYADKTIPQLENAVPDVDAVSRIFADRLGYEVRVVRNPDKAAIIRTLNGLAAEMNSQDSVVVYYAGHGYALEKNGAGYWIPSDAKAVDPHGWISNNDVAKLLGGIRAKQMALISDSCYSGAFAREGMDAVGHDVTVDDVLAKRSVVVLSSGGDEPVADEGKEGHSIFAWNLMQVVGNVRDWKPGSTIFTDVQTGVKKEFPQTPKYGAVTAAGHQRGGDYLFELR
jgi:filamentous hemagglutinin family protein